MGHTTGKIDPFFMGDIRQTIMRFLEQASPEQPAVVGPLYVIARVTRKGLDYDSLGACTRQKTNHK